MMPIMEAKKVMMDVATLQPMSSGNDFDISTLACTSICQINNIFSLGHGYPQLCIQSYNWDIPNTKVGEQREVEITYTSHIDAANRWRLCPY